MKVFLVVTERDGKTSKEPGKTSTDIIKTHRRYAAETLDQVWRAAKFLNTEDETVTAILEEHPAITILSTLELP